MANQDLVLNSNCSCCGMGSPSPMKDFYGSNCKHLTLCFPCGKKMAENGGKCFCGTPVTRLIREYNVRTNSNHQNNTNYFLCRFPSGLPKFSDPNNHWYSKGQVTAGSGATRNNKNNNRRNKQPLLIEDKFGTKYQGKFDAGECLNYYLMVRRGTEIQAIHLDSWCNFSKLVKSKVLSLEEAEEMMKNRRKNEDVYNRMILNLKKKVEEDDDEEEQEQEKEKELHNKNNNDKNSETVTGKKNKNRQPLKKKTGDGEEEGMKSDEEMNDVNDNEEEDTERCDGWEHEEMFADDEEAMDFEDQLLEGYSVPQIPPPPEINQNGDDDEEIGLSESGKELKKLLAKPIFALNQSSSSSSSSSSSEEEEEEEEEENEEEHKSQIPPLNLITTNKRKIIDVNNGSESNLMNNNNYNTVPPLKKLKSETREVISTPPATVVSGGGGCPVTKEEMRNFLLSRGKSVTIPEFSAKYKERLKTKEEREKATLLLKSITRIKRNGPNGSTLVVLVE